MDDHQPRPARAPVPLHVWPFTVLAVSDNTLPVGVPQDVVLIPARGWVRLRIPFTTYSGRSVYHCHILDHEDAGMMATVNVRGSAETRHAADHDVTPSPQHALSSTPPCRRRTPTRPKDPIIVATTDGTTAKFPTSAAARNRPARSERTSSDIGTWRELRTQGRPARGRSPAPARAPREPTSARLPQRNDHDPGTAMLDVGQRAE
jgi:hypothetical protein